MFKLTEKQQEIIACSSQVKLVIGGHRSGKTILAIMNMWNYMKLFKNPNLRCAFLVNSDRLIRYSEREIKRLISIDNIINTTLRHDSITIETKFGYIMISTQLIPIRYDNITIDNATSNKYATTDILKEGSNIYITGHLPDDINNSFFRWWLKEYFADTKRVSAFRISENYTKIEDKEEAMINSIGIRRFNRDYKAIPDYMSSDYEKNQQQAFKRENLAEFIEKVENNEISFNPKSPFFMGFDKAKDD